MAPLALTCGDPGGIGLEIAIEAWFRRKAENLVPFYLLADPEAVRRRAVVVGRDIAIAECGPGDATASFAQALPVVPLRHPLVGDPGAADRQNAPAIIEAIDRAVDDCLNGRARAVVTLPIAKKPLHDAGFAFPGHTEYLAHLARRGREQRSRPVMMLAGPELRAVPATVHVPLVEVARLLTCDLITETGRIVHRELRSRFGIAEPRLAVAGLNPHAGEQGAFGTEEREIIMPAIASLAREGISVTGPLPADTMFHPGARNRYDAAICMYHDQALIPVKTLDFERTVNVTLGLPFIRTSPDHGTAFDLAGSGRANPRSLIEAIRLAASLAEGEASAAAA